MKRINNAYQRLQKRFLKALDKRDGFIFYNRINLLQEVNGILYNVLDDFIFVEEAMTVVQTMFPRMGKIRTTEEVVSAMK